MIFLDWISPIHLARKEKRELDLIGYVIIVFTLFVTIPQVIVIFENQSAEDVSLHTWVGYTVIALWWLFYGLARGVKPIVLSSLVHLFVDIAVVYGIIKFEGLEGLNIPF